MDDRAARLGMGAADLDALPPVIGAALAEWAGEADSLPALRGLWALAHGYVSLELTDSLQRGGDLSATFDRAIRAYLAGLKTISGESS